MSKSTELTKAPQAVKDKKQARDEWFGVRGLLTSPWKGGWGRWLALLGIVIAVGASLYHIYIPFVGAYETFVLRPLHLMLIGLVGLIFFDIRGRQRSFLAPDWTWLIDGLLVLALVGASLNAILNPSGFEERYAFYAFTQMDIALAVALVVVVVELARRCIGLPIAALLLIMLAYGLWGGESFSIFRHRPIPPTDLFLSLYMTTKGIFGSPIGAIATYVFLFIIFGAFIERSQTGMLIQRCGLALTGRSPGGPAKVAVVTSASFGSISGSALANVMATGAVTIPLMKRIGIKPHNAAGIEAAASSGGQLTPPIMGAVAFVMADITGVPYTDIIIAAALPALLFYVSLFMAIDLTARRDGMQGVPDEMMPKKGEILRLAHMILPLAALVATLIAGYSPMMAALVGLGTAIVAASLRPETRLGLRDIVQCLHVGARTTVIATVACAAAGIVVGVINETGLGLRLSSQLLTITDGNMFLALILVMVTCVILGMGMPTVAAYIVTVAIGGPILIELGVPIIAAHMFVLYFAVLSLITPPVMIASFGAAALADAKVAATGNAAVKYAGMAFMMPFIFVYNPELLIIGSDMGPVALVYTVITAVAGAVAFGVAVSGHPAKTIPERLLYLGIAYCMVEPSHFLNLLGLVLAGAHIATRYVLACRASSSTMNKE
ncbi:TRAP transporter permease [Halomonas kalidii]|uniref:TRAP transporter fused permease subunit n=1 Tax=Halomonas kalidii TaxID=3043293 RepID=A0ABT6VQR3_9GAMM|nr:TRAP transporter fused permease subunit [Halomonas kalidii]MDI5936331.1 TRAP transporter fused permease subunit [Halomonas kalidii]